ncbi:molecular chaperone [Cytobacillus sp. Hz8]|uniref:TorD/DmsD family molecular chaperone n=1 Tax=Cytobacillus sp. Hz8 TaxID=3347168 RepID=UPI0035DAD13E
MTQTNTQMTVSDLSHLLFAREYAYDILRRFFIEEPSQEYLKLFAQQRMIKQFPFIDDSPEIEEGVNEIQQYLSEFDVVHNQSHFDDLHWDYTRMFIGPFELPVPPWESVYVRKDRLLFQQNTIDVRKEYEQFGYKVFNVNFEADDHIGLELDFLYHLNNRCVKLSEEETGALEEVKYLLNEQQEFLNHHLLPYVSEFCEKVIEHADTQFFRGMAKILNSYLKMDSEVLNELLKIDFIQ